MSCGPYVPYARLPIYYIYFFNIYQHLDGGAWSSCCAIVLYKIYICSTYRYTYPQKTAAGALRGLL